MAKNPYDSCPCGSGKKIKFCCAPYFTQIEQALNQQQAGQHEACLATMKSLTEQHKGYAPVWGYYAQILYNEGRADDAEKALEEAFKIQPNFPMGLFLRGLFRQNEGELIGSLLLFRKAAEAYDPQATTQLSYVYELIARAELLLNRVVAARAALEKAVHLTPQDLELREQFNGMFGPESRLPNCAKKPYSLRRTMRPIPTGPETGRFTDVRKVYEQLTTEAPNDPAGWFNLGLARAWLGEQPAAVEALLKSIELEMDDARAEEAAALVEVLKCGQGMENDSDYIEHRAYFPIRDPNAVFELIQVWGQEGRLLAPQMAEDGSHFGALLVEPIPTLLETGTRLATITANVAISGGVLRFYHSDLDTLNKVATEAKDRLNLAIGEKVAGQAPAQFGDVAREGMAFPISGTDPNEIDAKMTEHSRHYYEDVWARKPIRSLGGAAPIDAAGSKLMRKRLLGIIRFLEDCHMGVMPRKNEGDSKTVIGLYDFAKLRHKLGVEVQASASGASSEHRDFAVMNAAELAAVPLAELSVAQLAEGMRAAMKLDARELAVAYAKAAVARPAEADYPDRFPFYLALANGLASSGDATAAAKLMGEGLAFDRDHNGGKRAGDFGRQKAKILARAGETDDAVAAFEAVIAENPDDPRNYIDAAETMVRVKSGASARLFAEKGLAKAKSTGNRDLEGACQELLAAAKKLG